MKGPVEPVHRSVPETIQEVIELTGFLCFLFRSTPRLGSLRSPRPVRRDDAMMRKAPQCLETQCHEVPKIRCCDDAEARATSTQRYLSREGHQSWTNSRLGRAPTPPTDEYPYDDYEGFDDDGLFKYDDDPRDD